ncbi:MAG: hypothetical protein M3250_02700 [Thermoproteota archaeon]|nr:hypothetical protein [Thermoproteota archaeon]
MRLQLNLDIMKKTHGQIEDAVIDDISRLLFEGSIRSREFDLRCYSD